MSENKCRSLSPVNNGIGRMFAESNAGYVGSSRDGSRIGCVKIGDAGIDSFGGGPSGADIVGLVAGEGGGVKVENLTWRGREEEPGRDVAPDMGS